MRIKLEQFKGIAPAVAPRMLNEVFGQTANNVDFEPNVLRPIKNTSNVTTLTNSIRRSIYKYDATGDWLQWDDDFVKVAEGPIGADNLNRLYWTGEDYPRMGVQSTIISGGGAYPGASYRLGVPAPPNAPGTAAGGTPDATQTPNDVSYVYTFVTAYGEEGPPSPASTPFELTDTESVTVTMPAIDQPSGNYNFGAGALKRVYRSNTGSTNTQFQFAGEVAFTSTTFVDTNTAATLGEILPSSTWIGPPDDDSSTYPEGPMQGLIPVANGVFAGFTGKRLCFSEPYLPHAWPIDYRITMQDDIVAIATVANAVVCFTTDATYFVTGVDPSAMTAQKAPIAQACINKNSVVDMGDYVFYASPDGLVVVSSQGAEVVTRGAISFSQWNADYFPTIIRAFEYEGTYVAFYDDGGSNVGGWVYDPRGEEGTLSTIDGPGAVRGGWTDMEDGEMYLIVGNAIEKYRGGNTDQTVTWKSKKFVLPKPSSMAWVAVYAEAYPIDVKVWVDGTLIADYNLTKSGSVYTQTTTTPGGISNATLREPIMRLPAKVGYEFEIQVSGAVEINEVWLSQTIEEIREEQ